MRQSQVAIFGVFSGSPGITLMLGSCRVLPGAPGVPLRQDTGSQKLYGALGGLLRQGTSSGVLSGAL